MRDQGALKLMAQTIILSLASQFPSDFGLLATRTSHTRSLGSQGFLLGQAATDSDNGFNSTRKGFRA